MIVAIKHPLFVSNVFKHLTQSQTCSKIILNFCCSASKSTELTNAETEDTIKNKLLDDINGIEDLSAMVSVLEGNKHLLNQGIVLAAVNKMAKIYQKDYDLSCRFDEDTYSRAFQSLGSIIDNFNVRAEEPTSMKSKNLDPDNIDILATNFKNAIRGKRTSKQIQDAILQLENTKYEMNYLQAMSIFKSLLVIQDKFEGWRELLSEVYNVLIRNFNKLSEDNIKYILGNLIQYIRKNKAEKFANNTYDPEFLDNFSENIIKRKFDIETYHVLLRCLNMYRHRNLALIEYMLSEVLQTHSKHEDFLYSKFYLFCDLIGDVANVNLKSKDLKKMLDSLDFKRLAAISSIYNLVQLSFNLALMDYYNSKMLQKVFKNHKSYKQNPTLLWVYCKLWQKIRVDPYYSGPMPTIEQIRCFSKLHGKRTKKFPLLSTLKKIIGDETLIKTDLITKLHHEIDHVICYRKGGYPVLLKEDDIESQFVEDLPVVPDSILILITRVSGEWFFNNGGEMMARHAIYEKTLEALSPNWQIVTIRNDVWAELSEEQRTSCLIDEIKVKLDNASLYS